LVLQTQLTPKSTFPAPVLPGSTPIDEWQIETAYSIGAFVIFNAAVYVAISTSGNTGQLPNASGSTYWVACSGGTGYMSLINGNFGNSPSSAPALWASGTSYSIGNQVGGSDGFIYTSLANSNLGNNPTTDAGVHWTNTGVYNPWTSVFTQGNGNSLWTQLGGALFPNGAGLDQLNITYPVNAGPLEQTWSRNVYRLPANYLRRAPEDPKGGNFSVLGAPSNMALQDWVFEGDYMVTTDAQPIVLRFVADEQDVTKFSPMFSEGLAARIAMEVAEILTQSTAKVSTIAKFYGQMMTEARLVNAVETGYEEPPLDDYIACRM
jgi:hypothetical protein